MSYICVYRSVFFSYVRAHTHTHTHIDFINTLFLIRVSRFRLVYIIGLHTFLFSLIIRQAVRVYVSNARCAQSEVRSIVRTSQGQKMRDVAHRLLSICLAILATRSTWRGRKGARSAGDLRSSGKKRAVTFIALCAEQREKRPRGYAETRLLIDTIN